jgi:hypothetical protein
MTKGDVPAPDRAHLRAGASSFIPPRKQRRHLLAGGVNRAALLAVLVGGVVLSTLVAGCLDPKDRRPGLRLSGTVVTETVDDWSFADANREIYIEVATPYLVPHSVTIVCAALDGRLYVGARHPMTKRWVGYVERNPEVRLKIGDDVYEERLVPVDNAAEHDAVYDAYAAKYGWQAGPTAERPPMLFFRVVARS